MQPTQNPPVDVQTPAQTLRDAALYLERHGWIQGAFYDASSGSWSPPACVVGALGMVCYGGPVDAPALNVDDPGYDDFATALALFEAHLASFLFSGEDDDVYTYNEAKDRTAEEVIRELRFAADCLSPVHVDEPHRPGSRYDCDACTDGCLCTDGFTCLYCVSVDAFDAFTLNPTYPITPVGGE